MQKKITLTENEVSELKLTLEIELKNPETPAHRRCVILSILEKL